MINMPPGGAPPAPYPALGAFMPGGQYALPPGFGQSGLQTAYGGPQTGAYVLPGGMGQQTPPPPAMFGPGWPPPPPQNLPATPGMAPGGFQNLGAGGGVLPDGLGGLGGLGMDPTFLQALMAMQQSPTGYGAPPITPTQPYGATPAVLPPQLSMGAVPPPPGIPGAGTAPPPPAPAPPPLQPQAPITPSWGTAFGGGRIGEGAAGGQR
jgi:hypothetical protein